MKSARVFVAAIIALALLTGPISANQGAGKKSLNPQLQEQLMAFDLSSGAPVEIIVTLSEEPAAKFAAGFGNRGQAIAGAARQSQLNKVRAQRGRVISELARLGVKGNVRHQFEEAANGFSITVPSDQLETIAGIDGVTGIYIDAPVVRLDDDGGESLVTNVAPELASSVPAIRAPALWNRGFRGEGILVAIIDDGVDYTHPDLGGCFGTGCKVVGGYDFVDLDGDPQEGLTAGARDYHGTHVAATAAGLRGVAPDAKILAIRVLGSNSTGKPSNLSVVMSGIDYAVRNGAHVANMSLGLQNTYAQSSNLWGAVVSNAIAAGVVFTNSNGNNGPNDYTTGVYAASPHTIGVGNSDARPLLYPRTILTATGESLVGGSYGAPFPASLLGVQLNVIDAGYGNSADDYAGKDVTGKLALAQRGGPGDPTFTNKANQARLAGAVGIIIYNDVGRMVDFSTAALSLPSFTMSHPNGLKVQSSPSVVVEEYDPGIQMNAGSSRGPTPDLQIKPDVTAPGTAIVAAVPYQVSSTGYAALNGTSMSAPHVAGAAALLLQANPTWTPQQVKIALMNTAANLTQTNGMSYRVVEQGSGFADLERALTARLAIEPGSVSFGQVVPASGFTSTRTLTLAGKAAGVYNVTTQFSRSWSGVTATTSAAQVVVGTSGSVSLTLTVTAQASTAPGEYEGYVNFVNVADPSDTYRVPFHFAHRLVVAEVSLSNPFIGTLANNRESVTVRFKIGQPISSWYLGTMAGTRFTANQTGLNPGSYSMVWNGRTSTGNLLAEGNWNIGVWYQLPGSTVFVFSQMSYARFFVDRTAPLIGIDAVPPGLTRNSTLRVSGAVADSGIYTWGAVGGRVLVNGNVAELTFRSPNQVFGGNSEMNFFSDVTLVEGTNTIAITAEDAAGNRSTTTLSYSVDRDSTAPAVTFTGGRTWTVAEQVLVQCSAFDSLSGLATDPCTAPLVDSPGHTLPLGPATVTVTAVDVAGNSTTASVSYSVVVTYDSLVTLSRRFAPERAIGDSLVNILNQAGAAAARNQTAAANNQLVAYQNHVAAQAGKALSAGDAATLIRLAEALKK